MSTPAQKIASTSPAEPTRNPGAPHSEKLITTLFPPRTANHQIPNDPGVSNHGIKGLFERHRIAGKRPYFGDPDGPHIADGYFIGGVVGAAPEAGGGAAGVAGVAGLPLGAAGA